jgi:hypothetical protein
MQITHNGNGEHIKNSKKNIYKSYFWWGLVVRVKAQIKKKLYLKIKHKTLHWMITCIKIWIIMFSLF